MKDKVYLIQDEKNPGKFHFVTVSNPLPGKNAVVYDRLMRSTFKETPLSEVVNDNTGIELFNNLYAQFFAKDGEDVDTFEFVVISDLVPPENAKFFKKNEETGEYEEISEEFFNSHNFTMETMADEFAVKNHCLEAVELLDIKERRFFVDDSIQEDLGEEYKIIIDSKTGVQYLHYQGLDDKGQDGATMCVLVDKNGKPLLAE